VRLLRNSRLVGILALLWLMIVLAAYYIPHKPITTNEAISLAVTVWHLLTAGAIIALGGGVGRKILPAMELEPLVRCSVQAGLGLGVLGIGWLLIGVLVGFSPSIAFAVVALLGVLFWRETYGWLILWNDLPRLWCKGGRFERVLGVGMGTMLLLLFVRAAAPPVKFDALVYHLALPKFYVLQGRMVFLPENVFWGMPQLVEMLFTWAWELGGPSSAAVLGLLGGGLALVGILGYCAQRWDETSGWVAVVALLSGFTLATSLNWAYVGGMLMLVGLGFFVLLDSWQRTLNPRDVTLAGVFAGLALGIKYSGGILVLIGLGFLLWRGWRYCQFDWGAALRFLLAAGLVSSPWWVKNALATGNPFYPFFFPAGEMDAFRLWMYQSQPAWGGLKEALLLPWQATVWGVEGAPGFSASIGPLLLGLGLLAFWNTPVGTETQRQTLSLAVWGLASRFSGLLIQIRLYLAVFPALAILAGIGFSKASRLTLWRFPLRRTLAALVMFAFALNLWQVGVSALSVGAPQVLAGLRSSEDFLEGNLGGYLVAMRAISELPATSRVLMLWEPRSLYCLPQCDPDEVLDRWIHDRHRFTDPNRILESWQQAGYTHVLFYRQGAEFVRRSDPRYLQTDWQALTSLLNQLTPLEDFGTAYTLYRLP
jgi:hypothetical protein